MDDRALVDIMVQAIHDPRMERRHLRVLVEIVDSVDPVTRTAAPGRLAVSERSGYSVAVVAKTTSELIGAGYVTSQKRRGERGARSKSHYAIHRPVGIGRRPPRRNLTWTSERMAERTALRRRMIAAFSCRCEYCGVVQPDAPNVWHIDRIVPGACGGMYVPDNVALACSRCNLKKKAADYVGPIRSLAIMEGMAS